MASPQAPPKKPRLSLQIKTTCDPASRPARTHKVDPKDPTAFNTLSNVYSTAIERSTPLTAINTLQAFSLSSPVDYQDSKHRVATPYVAHYPETPLSANPMSPRPMEVNFPSTMTATPPLSGTTDSNDPKVFTFSSTDTGKPTIREPNSEASRSTSQGVVPYRTATHTLHLPYSQPQILHSILRNSPLPPKTAIPPPSPRRQSLRLAEKAARRVGYNSPLEQEIVTNKYTKSHNDLLAEEASPNSPSLVPNTSEEVLDLTLAFTPNEVQDGGQTPGPFEETRRRMAGFGLASPSSPAGIRKRKKREKKRRWVWTIGQEEDEGEDVGGAVAALRAEAARQKQKAQEEEVKTPRATAPPPELSMTSEEEVPTPSVEGSDSSWDDTQDVDMTDLSSIASSEDLLSVPSHGDGELDVKTPIAPNSLHALSGGGNQRDTPIPESASRRDTPVPPEQLKGKRDTPVPPEYE